MKSMIIFALLLAAGLAQAEEQLISVQHDSQRGVTCWITAQGGISCLPDSSLLQARESAPTVETQAARASLEGSEVEIEPFMGVSLPQAERVQL